MKRIMAFLSTLFLLCFSACGSGSVQTEQTTDSQPLSLPQTTAEDASPSAYFALEKLPDIGTRKQGVNNGRFFPEYRDTFEPRKDYGSIVPYIGSVFYYTSDPYGDPDDENSFSEFTLPQYRYGLMTGDGRIVVDDVYVDLYFAEDIGACGAYCATPFAARGANSLHPERAESEADYERLLQASPEKQDTWYVSADGTWALHFPSEKNVKFGKERIAVAPSEMYGAEPDEFTVQVYDYAGKLQYTLPVDPAHQGRQAVSIRVFWLDEDVLLAEYLFETSSGYTKTEYFFRDKSGNSVLTQFQYAVSCSDFEGRLLVEQPSGSFHLVDKTGQELCKPSSFAKTELTNHQYYLIIEQDGAYLVLDTDLRQVGKPKSFQPYLMTVNGVEAYSDSLYCNASDNWRLDTDEPIERQEDEDSIDYIGERYIGINSGDHDVTLRDTKTGKDLVTVQYASVWDTFADGELLYLFGLYGQKKHSDHLYSLKEHRMLLEKDTISCYSNQENVYVVYYGNGQSTVLNYTTGKIVYQKTIE